MTFPARPVEETAEGLLVESYHSLAADPSRSGLFYRKGKHGLCDRIRNFLAARGIQVPAHKPTPDPIPSHSHGGRPVLTLVPGGLPPLSCGDADEFTCEAEPGRGVQEEQ